MLHVPSNINVSEGNDEGLQTLIRHEYTHIIHMEFNDRAVTEEHGIFGHQTLLFPHVMIQSMLVKWLVVYIEGLNKQDPGRLHDSHLAMQMRMEVARGQLADLN
ncbi:hypothetical protein [Candidatus Enterovibrio escicola]|uniref:hypothetical protein n=1 Tax=Candidatus Enterovibrio escicola TaxID=1927127 RepID=UPI0030D93EF2